jgi:hypothetical protein
MTFASLIRTFSPASRRVTPVATSLAAEREDRLRRAVHCDGCRVWSQSLMYLPNGGLYCRRCAGRVAVWALSAPRDPQAVTTDGKAP